MRLILPPVAYLLPRRLAIGVADICSLVLLILPSPGFVEYWKMRAAFGKGRMESVRLSRLRVRRQLRDFVVLKRILNGREKPRNWRILEKNVEAVRSIRESGCSYIVATAHFHREALIALSCPEIVPGKLLQISHPTPPPIGSVANLIRLVRRDGLYRTLYHQRIRMLLTLMARAYSAAWDRTVDYTYVSPELAAAGGLSSAITVYQRLKRPGNVVNIHIDSLWLKLQSGSHCRAFAGLEDSVFSTGAAQLAKLARCPILSCIYWARDDGTIVVEWGKPILRVDDEVQVTNDLLQMMEGAIGERPAHYVLEIGSQRRWDAACGRWTSNTVPR